MSYLGLHTICFLSSSIQLTFILSDSATSAKSCAQPLRKFAVVFLTILANSSNDVARCLLSIAGQATAVDWLYNEQFHTCYFLFSSCFFSFESFVIYFLHLYQRASSVLEMGGVTWTKSWFEYSERHANTGGCVCLMC